MFNRTLKSLDYNDAPGSIRKLLEVIVSMQNDVSQSYREMELKIKELEKRIQELEGAFNNGEDS